MKFETKLKFWKNKLLDLGKRNKLINYKDTKRSSLTILSPSLYEVWDKLVNKEKEIEFPFYNNYWEEEIEEIEEELYEQNNDIKVNQSVKELQKTLRNIRTRARLYNEEQGINPLYLAFGFLNWKESEESDYNLASPLILVPIEIEAQDLLSPFKMKMRDDEIIINPALDYKLQSNFGISIYDEELDNDIEEFLENVRDKIKKMNWTVEEKVAISMFSFYKISMYEDLENNKELIESSPIVQAINGNPSLLPEIPEYLNHINHDRDRKVEEVYQILDADSSQLDAIEYAKSGVSFILQGPPGTGKSQTIANIIAELITSGKKVLFVSSKMAALDVVYRRLEKVELSDFCLSLHNPKTSRKEILDQFENVFDLAKDRYQLNEQAKMKLQKLQIIRDRINQYNIELHKIREPFKKTIFQINGNVVQLSNVEDIIFDIENIENMTQEQFSTMIYTLEDYTRTLDKNSVAWKESCWKDVQIPILTNELRHDLGYYMNNLIVKLKELKEYFREIQQKLPLNIDINLKNADKLIELLTKIDQDYDIPKYWLNTNDLEHLFEEIDKEEQIKNEILMLQDKIKNLQKDELGFNIKNDTNHILSDLTTIEEDIAKDEVYNRFRNYSIKGIHETILDLKNYLEEYNKWKIKLSDTYEDGIFNIDSKEIINRFKSEYNTPFRIFKKNYRKDRKQFLANRKEITKDITYNDMIDTLSILSNIRKLKEDKAKNREKFKDLFGILYYDVDTDVNQIEQKLEYYKTILDIKEYLGEIKLKIESGTPKEKLEQHYSNLYQEIDTNWKMLKEKLLYFKEIREESESLEIDYANLCDIYENNINKNYMNQTIADLKAKIEDCRPEYEWFKNLFQNQIDHLEISELIEKISQCKVNIDMLEKYIDYENAKKNCYKVGLKNFIHRIEEEKFDKEQIIPIFKKRFYRLWLDSIEKDIPDLINFRKEVFENTIKEFKELDEEQLELARVRVLNRLLENLPNLDRLTNGTDEVSILKKEMNKKRKSMSLRKLFRFIPNLIVNLKPCLMMSPLSVSIFLDSSKYKFDTVIFDEASQIKTEDAIGAICRGNQVIIVGDNKQLPPTNFFSVTSSEELEEDDDEFEDLGAYESILDEASLLPEKTLLWHYRSKNESLIAFSNAKFYKNKLITFPSNNEKVKNNGVEFIYVENGRYDRGGKKGNVEEAKKVAELVFEHFLTTPERSLGVIAFGEVQQIAIENEINRIRIEKPQFESFFREENQDAFFVKNLENVQGDERDSIIFSIGYAKDLNNKMNMNFGPLSKFGGERRLNVAVTRAKYNIKLVSSILPSDINTEKITTEGPKLLRKYIEYAKEGVNVLGNEITINQENYFDSPFEESVYNFLVEKGYEVCTQVGCSGYRIDMAVKHPYNKDKFALGIECDGAMYHSTRTARERDRLRQMILEEIGWKIYRIWSTDWVKNRQKEENELINAIREAILLQGEKNSKKIDKADRTESISEEFKGKVDYDNPYNLEKYEKFNYNILNHGRLGTNEIINLIIDTEYPIHFDEICRRCAPHLGFENATKSVKENIERVLILNQSKYDVDDNFYMPQNAEIRARGNLMNSKAFKRPLKYIYKKELALIMKKVLDKSVGIDKESLIKETAKTLGYSTGGNNYTYFNNAFHFIDKL